jgi:HK97 family phage portal protein
MQRIRNGDAMSMWQKGKGSVDDSLELTQIVDHPFLDMMHMPNPMLTGRQSLMVTQKNIDIKGEAFWWIDQDELGRVNGYWVLPSHWITETPSDTKPYYRANIGSQQLMIPQEEVVWFRIPKVVDPYGRGSGVGESLGDELDTDEYAANYTKAFFYNRARPDVLISFEEVEDPDAIGRARKEWNNRLRGHGNAHQAHFIGGKVTINELSTSLADIDMTKLRGFERDTITGVFGVPPEVLGRTQQANRATVTMALTILAQNVIIPRLELLRDVIQHRVLPLFDDRLIAGYHDPTPDDEDLQLEYMSARPETATRGEWRKRQGLPPRGDVDEVHLQGMATVLAKPEATGSQVPSKDSKSAEKKKSMIRALTAPVIDATLAKLTTQPITTRIDPLWADELSVWINAEASKVGAQFALGKYSHVVAEHIAEMGLERTTLIVETTKKQLRKVLTQAVEDGLDARRAGKLVREVMGGDLFKNRSRMIAISEVNRSSNYGTFYAHSASGVVEERQWVATVSLWESVRDNHKALHDQIVKINEPFVSPDGDTGMYPGDFNNIENNANCRCSTVAVIDDDIKSADDLVLLAKQFIAETDPWIDRAADAYFAAFQEQAEQIEQELLDRAA